MVFIRTFTEIKSVFERNNIIPTNIIELVGRIWHRNNYLIILVSGVEKRFWFWDLDVTIT